jgi:hypothetical protein
MRDKLQPISVRQILPSVVARNSEADKLSVAAFHNLANLRRNLKLFKTHSLVNVALQLVETVNFNVERVQAKRYDILIECS